MPEWKQTVDLKGVFHSEELSLEEKSKAIVARVRALPGRAEGEDPELDQILEELEDAGKEDDERWFDSVWDGFYDWADAERVWVATL